MLNLERNMSKDYQFPNKNLVSKDILDTIHDQKMVRNLSLIKKSDRYFGFLFLGDDDTIYRITLLNMFGSSKNLTVSVLVLFDCQVHLADGNKKYGTFIFSIFLENIIEIDTHKKMTDVVMFDGAYNVQFGGEHLRIQYTNIAVMRGVHHTVSLFFIDVTKFQVLNQIIKAHKAIYNLFGSGIYNKFHSIFKS